MLSADSLLDRESTEALTSILGLRHVAVVPTALVDGANIAVGKVFFETMVGTLSIRLEFAAVDLCGIQQDCTRLVVRHEDNARTRGSVGNTTLVHSGNEAIDDISVIETVLTRSRPGLPDQTFVDHTGIVVTFEGGCLAITKLDQVTPSLEVLIGEDFSEIELPDPCPGWPSDSIDTWVGESRLVPLP